MAKTRILIVDDEKSFTRIAKINLERTGKYRVREENKGSRALATAQAFNPHLVLLDIIMPDVGGGDVAAQIKDDPKLKDVPIVFVTALIKKNEERIISGSSYVAKPVKLQTLIACIEKALKN